jgi:hypothetical protein
MFLAPGKIFHLTPPIAALNCYSGLELYSSVLGGDGKSSQASALPVHSPARFVAALSATGLAEVDL